MAEEEEQEDLCGICLVNLPWCRTSCNHGFCGGCLMGWWERKHGRHGPFDCPMCKQTVRHLTIQGPHPEASADLLIQVQTYSYQAALPANLWDALIKIGGEHGGIVVFMVFHAGLVHHMYRSSGFPNLFGERNNDIHLTLWVIALAAVFLQYCRFQRG